MRSRKSTLKSMSSLVGNSAAHLALFPDDAFVIRELVLYQEQAAALAEARTWNEVEISQFREKSVRHATNVIRQRQDKWQDRKFQELLQVAIGEIDDFIASIFDED